MYPVVGLLAAAELLSAAPPQELTLQQVLKANAAAIQAIRSIHVTLNVANNTKFPDEDKPPEALPTYTYEWFKDDNRQRVRKMKLRGSAPAPENDDGYNGPDGWKRLEHYDPNFKPPLSESISAPAVGEIDKTHADDNLSGTVRGLCWMQLFNRPTEEYVLKNPTSKLTATPATSKLGCYEITMLQEKPKVPGSTDDVRELRIFVDPKFGFWIRRTETGPFQKSTDPRDKFTGINEIEEFKDCGNGIFFPMRWYGNIRRSGPPGDSDRFTRLTVHALNQPLPDEVFQIHFPDWLRVYDKVSGKVFIWGPDDKPRMEFASKAEYDEWYKSRRRDPFQPQMLSPRTYWTLIVGISVAVGLLLLIAMAWRRRAARLVGGPSHTLENTQGDVGLTP
jgi:hypothetical protein